MSSNQSPSYQYGLGNGNSSQHQGVSSEMVNQRAKNLESQIARMQQELNARKGRNMELRQELNRLENSSNLRGSYDNGTGGGLLSEKDRLKTEISSLVKELVKKNENLRRISATYKMLREENETLQREVDELQRNESQYDKTIEEYSRAMEEYETLRNAQEESEFNRNEQMFITQMRLEENSRKHMESQVKAIADQMAKDKDLAKRYLMKYVEYLEKQAQARGIRY